MNAIENNAFTNDWADFGERFVSLNSSHLKRRESENVRSETPVYPNAVLVISAHWTTQGICVSTNSI